MVSMYEKEIRDLVIELRKKTGWGIRKIRRYLEENLKGKTVPSLMTIYRWLKEAGFINNMQKEEFMKKYMIGEKVIELFGEKAKRYGYNNVISYLLFLDKFYHENKDLCVNYKLLLKEYKKLKEIYEPIIKLIEEDETLVELIKMYLIYKGFYK